MPDGVVARASSERQNIGRFRVVFKAEPDRLNQLAVLWQINDGVRTVRSFAPESAKISYEVPAVLL